MNLPNLPIIRMRKSPPVARLVREPRGRDSARGSSDIGHPGNQPSTGVRATRKELMKNSNSSKHAASDKTAGDDKVSRKEALVQLRQTLISRRDSIRSALAGDLNLLRELRGQPSGDVVDAALDTAQDEISSQLAEVESRELASIETALERMRDGDYGVCESCNDGIPLARLQALPYAVMCIKCQRKAERNGTAPNGPRDWSKLLDSVSDSDLSADVEVDAG